MAIVNMDNSRLHLERHILNKYFPKRHGFFGLKTSDPTLDLGMKSNSGSVYRFRLMLARFPHAEPEIFLIF